MITSKGKVELIQFKKTEDEASYKYNVEHNNGSTSVDQIMTISSTDLGMIYGWKASIAMDEFPNMGSPELAAEKLADWMLRLSQAIRSGDYVNYQRSEFKDLIKEANNDS